MLEVPKRVGDHIVHHLLCCIDEDRARTTFRDCWPPFDKRREAQFYKAAFEWYKALVQQTRGCNNTSRLVVSRSVVMPGSPRYVATLTHLTALALTAALAAAGRPAALQQPTASSAAQCCTAAVVLKAHTARTCAAFAALQHTAAQHASSVSSVARELVQRYRSCSSRCDQLQQQLHYSCSLQQLCPERSSKDGPGDPPQRPPTLSPLQEAAAREWSRVDAAAAREALSWRALFPLVKVTSERSHVSSQDLVCLPPDVARLLLRAGHQVPPLHGGRDGTELDLTSALHTAARALHTLHAALPTAAAHSTDTGADTTSAQKAGSLTTCVSQLAADATTCLHRLQRHHHLHHLQLEQEDGGPSLCPPTPRLGVRGGDFPSAAPPPRNALLTASPRTLRDILRMKDVQRLQLSTVKRKPLLEVAAPSPHRGQRGTEAAPQSPLGSDPPPPLALDALLLSENKRVAQQRARRPLQPSGSLAYRRPPASCGKGQRPAPSRLPQSCPRGKENLRRESVVGPKSSEKTAGNESVVGPKFSEKRDSNKSVVGLKSSGKPAGNESDLACQTSGRNASNKSALSLSVLKKKFNENNQHLRPHVVESIGGKSESKKVCLNLAGNLTKTTESDDDGNTASYADYGNTAGHAEDGNTEILINLSENSDLTSNLAGKPARKTAFCRLFSPRLNSEKENRQNKDFEEKEEEEEDLLEKLATEVLDGLDGLTGSQLSPVNLATPGSRAGETTQRFSSLGAATPQGVHTSSTFPRIVYVSPQLCGAPQPLIPPTTPGVTLGVTPLSPLPTPCHNSRNSSRNNPSTQNISSHNPSILAQSIHKSSGNFPSRTETGSLKHGSLVQDQKFESHEMWGRSKVVPRASFVGTPTKCDGVSLQDLDPDDTLEKLMERMSFLTKSPYSSPSSDDTRVSSKSFMSLQKKFDSALLGGGASSNKPSSSPNLGRLKAESIANVYKLLELTPSKNADSSSNASLERKRPNSVIINSLDYSSPRALELNSTSAIGSGLKELNFVSEEPKEPSLVLEGSRLKEPNLFSEVFLSTGDVGATPHHDRPTQDGLSKKYVRRSGDLVEVLPSIEEVAFEKTDTSNLDEFLKRFEEKFLCDMEAVTDATSVGMATEEDTQGTDIVVNMDLSEEDVQKTAPCGTPGFADDEFLDGAVAVTLLQQDPDEGEALSKGHQSLPLDSVFSSLTDSILCGESDSALLADQNVGIQIAKERFSFPRRLSASGGGRRSSGGGRRLSDRYHDYHTMVAGPGILDVSASILLSTSTDLP